MLLKFFKYLMKYFIFLVDIYNKNFTKKQKIKFFYSLNNIINFV